MSFVAEKQHGRSVAWRAGLAGKLSTQLISVKLGRSVKKGRSQQATRPNAEVRFGTVSGTGAKALRGGSRHLLCRNDFRVGA
jgi:hypothetical protein